MEELIRIRELSTENPYEASLKDFRLQSFEGEILGLVGLNGSGKRTLVKVLSGEINPVGGHVFLQGKEIISPLLKPGRNQLEREGLFVVQNINRLIKDLSISENLSISSNMNFFSMLRAPHNLEKISASVLDEFIPELDRDTPVDYLPPAEHARVGLLKAYMEGAKLIVLDGVLEVCRRKEEEALITLLKRLRSRGVGIIVTYNRVAPFLQSFDRVAVISGGQLKNIMFRDSFNQSQLADLIVGGKYREQTAHRESSDPPVSSRILDVRNISLGKNFRNCSFYLCSGEILGIHDPLNETAHRLLQLFSGIIPLEQGRIHINGRVQELLKEHNALQSGLGIVSEKFFEYSFFRGLNAGENLEISAAKSASSLWGHIPSSLHHYFQKNYLRSIGFSEELLEQPVEYLDRDLQFILVLHMKILSGAKIFILENPVQSADLLSRDLIYRKMSSLRKKGMGAIFISGSMGELDGFCDRILYCDYSEGILK